MVFMVDFSFTWLSLEPNRCASNTSESNRNTVSQITKNATYLPESAHKCLHSESVCVCVCLFMFLSEYGEYECVHSVCGYLLGC